MNWSIPQAAVHYSIILYALNVTAWSIVGRSLPGTASAGLNLLATLLTQFLLNAAIVQALGVASLLKTWAYTCAVLLVFAIICARNWCELHRTFLELLRVNLRSLFKQTPFGLWYVFLPLLFVLIENSMLSEEYDTLNREFPRIASWASQGFVDLTVLHQLPPVWDYQFVPGIAIARCDVFRIVPWLFLVPCVFLAVREVARYHRAPPQIGALLGWLCVLTPMMWLWNTGASTVKNDIAFGVGLLTLIIALMRAVRQSGGELVLAQLGVFLLLGTKMLGIPLVAATFSLVIFFSVSKCRQNRSGLLKGLTKWAVTTAVVQVNAVALYIVNWVKYGNPCYPMRISLAGLTIFEGSRDLSGTSLLSHWQDLDTWSFFLQECTKRVGLEFAWLLFALGVAFAHGVISRRPPLRLPTAKHDNRLYAGIVWGLVILSWLSYLHTPFTRGLSPNDTVFIQSGGSLRFAFGQLCLTYVVVTAYAIHWFGSRRVLTALSILTPALLVYKWDRASPHGFRIEKTIVELVILMLALRLAMYLTLKLWEAWRPGTWPNTRKHVLGLATCAMTLSIGSLGYYELLETKRLRTWLPQIQPIWTYIWERYPEDRIIAVNPDAYFRYPLLGPKLSNSIRVMEITENSVVVPEDADLVYIQRHHYYQRPDIPKTVDLLQKQGWRVVVATLESRFVLLARAPWEGRQTSPNR